MSDEIMSRAEEVSLADVLFDRLWPLPRSITGDGVRATHDILAEHLPLVRHEIPTGTAVLDWTVPPEWRCRQAYVVTPDGDRILDFSENNLHVLNYSVPVNEIMPLAQLQEHLHSRPDLPDAVPYMTSYYQENWGFCIRQKDRDALAGGDYQVVIDSELFDGSLTISDTVLAGESDAEVLIATYTCHPSMANNELSGPLLALLLYRRLAARASRHYSYRFVFNPETIGAVAYLDRHGEHLRDKIQAGFVLTCVGDKGGFSYKSSRRGDSLSDRAAKLVLSGAADSEIHAFYPALGSDERQYCSPGFNLPVGVFMRSRPGAFVEYHTDLDRKGFVTADNIVESCDKLEEIIDLIESNRRYINKKPYGEPQLGKYGLYDGLGGIRKTMTDFTGSVLWLLNYSDGDRDLIDIATKSEVNWRDLHAVAEICVEKGLLEIAE